MINIIVAVSRNNVIGDNGKIPWRIPSDLARFKALTMNKTLVMGRKTYDSLVARLKDKTTEPLPGRKKIVLTKDPKFPAPHCSIVNNWRDIESRSNAGEEFWIIGGAEIYRLFLPMADQLFMSLVQADIEGDVFFPRWCPKDWEWAYDPINAIVEPDPRDEYRWEICDLRSKRV